MQRKRVVKSGAGANHDDGTSRKLNRKQSEDDTTKKRGVFRKLGFMLHTDKQDLGSTLKKRKPKKGTVRKSKHAVWNPDRKVHFNIDKGHPTIPLKGDPISDIQKKVFQKFAAEAVKKGPLEISMEFMSKLKPYAGQPMERKIFDANPTKNRYKDVICNDVTRVVLNDGYDGDYIHANYVNGLNVPFILTQGPTAATVIEFWRMIVHTKTSYIVMLCDVTEDGKPKCLPYFPEKVGDSVTYGVWTINCTSDDGKDTHVTKRTLSVKNADSGKEHILKHLHSKSWPDKSVPETTRFLLRMLFIVRTSPGPVTVHCSAGIGRTGTFVAIEACLQILTDGKELDLLAAMKALRNSRAGSVQVDVQYMVLIQILINYGKDNGYWDDADLDDRVELLSWNIKEFIQSRGRAADHLQPTPSNTNVAVAPAITPSNTNVAPVHHVVHTPPAPPIVAREAREARETREAAPPPPLPERISNKKKELREPTVKDHVVRDHIVKEPIKEPVPTAISPHNNPTTKDSTEDGEDLENDPKIQMTQMHEIPAAIKDDDVGTATSIPMPPVPPCTTSSPHQKKSEENARKSAEKTKEQIKQDRSLYFM